MTALLLILLTAHHGKAKPAPKPAGPPQPACKKSSKLVGACFKVHGRLAKSEGVPPVRITQDATPHLMAVEDTNGKPVDPWLPPEVRAAIDADHSAEADYLLCPLTELREGENQVVCIESASKVKRRSN